MNKKKNRKNIYTMYELSEKAKSNIEALNSQNGNAHPSWQVKILRTDKRNLMFQLIKGKLKQPYIS
jgi:hypothetical protein